MDRDKSLSQTVPKASNSIKCCSWIHGFMKLTNKMRMNLSTDLASPQVPKLPMGWPETETDQRKLSVNLSGDLWLYDRCGRPLMSQWLQQINIKIASESINRCLALPLSPNRVGTGKRYSCLHMSVTLRMTPASAMNKHICWSTHCLLVCSRNSNQLACSYIKESLYPPRLIITRHLDTP